MHGRREYHINRNLTDKFVLPDAGGEHTTVESLTPPPATVISQRVISTRHRRQGKNPASVTHFMATNQLLDSFEKERSLWS